MKKVKLRSSILTVLFIGFLCHTRSVHAQIQYPSDLTIRGHIDHVKSRKTRGYKIIKPKFKAGKWQYDSLFNVSVKTDYDENGNMEYEFTAISLYDPESDEMFYYKGIDLYEISTERSSKNSWITTTPYGVEHELRIWLTGHSFKQQTFDSTGEIKSSLYYDLDSNHNLIKIKHVTPNNDSSDNIIISNLKYIQTSDSSQIMERTENHPEKTIVYKIYNLNPDEKGNFTLVYVYEEALLTYVYHTSYRYYEDKQ